MFAFCCALNFLLDCRFLCVQMCLNVFICLRHAFNKMQLTYLLTYLITYPSVVSVSIVFFDFCLIKPKSFNAEVRTVEVW